MWNIFKKSDSDKKETKKGDSSKAIGNLPLGWLPYDNKYYFWWRNSQHGRDLYPKKQDCIPSWVETYEEFKPSVWLIGNANTTQIYLTTYEPKFGSMDAFAKIMFVDDGVPFKQMGKMCKELSKYNREEVQLHGPQVEKNYAISEEGKIQDISRTMCPDANSIWHVIEDIQELYADWRKFPDVENYNVVLKLSQAWSAVEKMQYEELGKNTIRHKIAELQHEIANCQESIRHLEQDLNKIYEEAADGLNVLEKHGINLENIETFQLKNIMSRTDKIDTSLAILKSIQNHQSTAINDKYSLAK